MIFSEGIEKYIATNSSGLPDYLKELERETHLKVLMPHMISGKEQGILLKMLVALSGAKNVLEIGTFTGYSAICMALGLGKDGKLITIEKNEELADIIHKYMAIAGLTDIVTNLFGDAKALLTNLSGPFDFVFIDADKQAYSDYYELIFPKVKLGGLILADNTLWKGKVIEPLPNKDTQALIDFNAKVTADTRVENLILPLRDGIHLIRKLAD
jgi:caffeoyl-CoA O-methyltransferase